MMNAKIMPMKISFFVRGECPVGWSWLLDLVSVAMAPADVTKDFRPKQYTCGGLLIVEIETSELVDDHRQK